MKKSLFASLAIAIVGILALSGCANPVDPDPTPEAPPLFADENVSYYIKDVDTPAGDENAMIAVWEGSGTVAVDASGTPATATFDHYPAWWGGGVAYVQKPASATGYFDLSGVKTISFEIKSNDIDSSQLGLFIQWLGADAGTGGEYTFALSDAGISNISDWTTVTIELADIPESGTTRYGKTEVAFAGGDGNQYVDTAFSIKWLGDAHTDPNSGTLVDGESYSIRNIAFEDTLGNDVAVYENIIYLVPSDAPPVPSLGGSSVISLLSQGTYTDITGTSWGTTWDAAECDTITVGSATNIKQVTLSGWGLGVEGWTPFDITGKTTLHIDYWTGNGTKLSVKVVDFGADGGYGGGDDVELEVALSSVAQNAWTGADLDFALLASKAHIAQILILPNGGAAGEIYSLGNVYFK